MPLYIEQLRELFPEKVCSEFVKGGKTREKELKGFLLDVFNSIKSFLPTNLVQSKLKPSSSLTGKIKGTILFADIAGFTSLSEKLSKRGKRGAEDITRIINGFFEPLLDIIFKWKGVLYRFGGDALISLFIDESGPDSYIRAVHAANESMNFVKENSTISVQGLGKFSIGMHIALVGGETLFYDLDRDFAMVGKLTNEAYQVGSLAERGEILVNRVVQKSLKNAADFIERENGIYKLTGIKERISPPQKNKKRIVETENIEELLGYIKILRPYFPPWLFERITVRPDFDPKDGEHRKLTVGFINFWGIPYKDIQEGNEKLKNFYVRVLKLSEKYGGYINKIDIDKKGERILIIFGYPRAMEDDERRACLFFDELIRDKEIKDMGIKLKAGLNSGSVFAGPVGSGLRREITVMGDNVNVAARLAAHAEKNNVLVSENVYKKTSLFFDFKELKPVKLKGKRKPLTLYQLKGKKVVDRSKIKRWVSESLVMVGREKEMERIEKIINRVEKKKGQLIGITGEAGIGKSRLVREVLNLLEDRDFNVFIGGCESYGSSLSYHPWVDILTEIFGILPGDNLERRKEKIEKYVESIDPKLKDWLPIIGEIVGIPFPETSLTKFIDAKLRKQRTFDLIFDFIKHEMKKRPVCVVIEDLHWADNASMELLNYIGRNIEDKQILMLLVFRPIKEKEEFMDKTYYKEFHLKELSKDDIVTLVENLLKIKRLPDELKKLIVTKSQGNPFYVEEIIKSLIETGFIREEKGKWRFVGDVKNVIIPDTIEGVILSRIDTLNWATRDVLQVASVLGREFADYMLKGIYPDKGVLKEALESLHALDLIKLEKGPGHIKYFFKHILTQEVAYGTLSFARRKELHERVGRYIEEKLKERKEEFLGLLSHHYFYAENYEKSLLYSYEAGERAKRAYANNEAIEFYTRAIESYERLNGK